jgi:heptosyltransferase-2
MKNLIIKCGAAGDVIRTTPIIEKLKGEIWWLTTSPHEQLLPKNIKVIDIKNISELKNKNFDLLLSLDDDKEILKIISQISYKKIIGAFLDDEVPNYTNSVKKWFDMGLISKLGIKKANKLKKQNKKTYQEFLFEFIEEEFTGQKYKIPYFKNNKNKNLIGIETRCGTRWPTKEWNKFKELAELLKQDGYDIHFLKQKETLTEYIQDISECSYLFCGDTLAMHIGIAVGCQTFGIFTCTPPDEIYDYDLLHKIYDPRIINYYYTLL